MIISESKKDPYLTEIINDETLIFSDVTKEKGGSEEELLAAAAAFDLCRCKGRS
jgi:hypothetical protein